LTFNGYQHTLSVFLPESGQPMNPPFERNYITRQLKIVEDKKSQELPLIYGLTFGNKKAIERK
jgi:lisH domain-containing protein FOPNL